MLETSDKDSKNEDSKELKRNGLYCFKKLWSSLAEDVMECKSLQGVVKLRSETVSRQEIFCGLFLCEIFNISRCLLLLVARSHQIILLFWLILVMCMFF